MDDISVIVENKEDMLEKINDTFKEYNMKINQWKIKILIQLFSNKQQIYPDIFLDGIMLEMVHSFTYLESKITNDGKSHTETVSQIMRAIQTQKV